MGGIGKRIEIEIEIEVKVKDVASATKCRTREPNVSGVIRYGRAVDVSGSGRKSRLALVAWVASW